MTEEQDKERAAFEAWCEPILGDNPNWRGSGDGELARQAFSAGRASVVAPQPADAADGWLNPEDMAALQRVDGTFQDGEGYDVPAPQMKRLAALGVLRHHSAGRYSITTFGQVVLGVECFRKPLETVDECNARLQREHMEKITAPPSQDASKGGGNG